MWRKKGERKNLSPLITVITAYMDLPHISQKYSANTAARITVGRRSSWNLRAAAKIPPKALPRGDELFADAYAKYARTFFSSSGMSRCWGQASLHWPHSTQSPMLPQLRS